MRSIRRFAALAFTAVLLGASLAAAAWAGSGKTPPVNTGLPSISGTTQDGQTLTANNGTWSGTTPLNFKYAWQRCNSTGSCVTLAATAKTYVLVSADVGATMRVQVTARNSAGSATATSGATGVVAGAPPRNTGLPVISGTTQVGQTLSATKGSWAGTTPMNFNYQWRRCDGSGGACADLSGATSTTYTTKTEDLGTTLRFHVTATNSLGTAAADSAATAPITNVPTTPPPTGGDPVIAAAGDIACDPTNSNFNAGNGTSNSCRQRYTSNLIVNSGVAAVLALGDNQYYCAGYQAFQQSYALSWGQFKSITYPVVGNHEYLTSGGTGCDTSNAGASGHFSYFGAAAGQAGQGWYSYDVGSWHLIALNSNCGDAGGCSSTSPQGKWLTADLAAHPNACTLAYWHIPLFSSGGRASSNSLSLWTQLYNAGADVVLSAHDHDYERFAPQTPSGTADSARGIREFIVGTGGANHTSFTLSAANSEIRNDSTYGVLKLTLHAGSYDWSFQPEAGATFADGGTGTCH
jgi:acid phosphatase type 7